jgi:hypothetical protein
MSTTPTVRDYTLHNATAVAAKKLNSDLAKMSEEDLLILRGQIDERLQVELKHINLTEELGLQYRQGQALLKDAQDDPEIPPNQRAQVYNSVASMLDKIIKLQGEVYSQERLKKYEAAFLKAASIMDATARAAFFDLYEEYLQDSDG